MTKDQVAPLLSPWSLKRGMMGGTKLSIYMRAKGGENMYKESLDNMMVVRKELASETRDLRNKEIYEWKEAREREVDAEERGATAEEKLVEARKWKMCN